jgi:hypothetical protein
LTRGTNRRRINSEICSMPFIAEWDTWNTPPAKLCNPRYDARSRIAAKDSILWEVEDYRRPDRPTRTAESDFGKRASRQLLLGRLRPEVAGSVFAQTSAYSLMPPSRTSRPCGTACKPTFSRNGYKNGYSDEKEGQPVRDGLLISLLLSDWCGGGDLNPYALRR